jgi:hypothetical protein
MMDREAISRQLPIEAWRFELVVFLGLFFSIAAVDAVSELHKIGHPIAELLIRALITAAIISGVLHATRGKGKRAG